MKSLYFVYHFVKGQWEDDERNGFGVARYCTGEVFDGFWKDDKQGEISILSVTTLRNLYFMS